MTADHFSLIRTSLTKKEYQLLVVGGITTVVVDSNTLMLQGNQNQTWTTDVNLVGMPVDPRQRLVLEGHSRLRADVGLGKISDWQSLSVKISASLTAISVSSILVHAADDSEEFERKFIGLARLNEKKAKFFDPESRTGRVNRALASLESLPSIEGLSREQWKNLVENHDIADQYGP